MNAPNVHKVPLYINWTKQKKKRNKTNKSALNRNFRTWANYEEGHRAVSMSGLVMMCEAGGGSHRYTLVVVV